MNITISLSITSIIIIITIKLCINITQGTQGT